MNQFILHHAARLEEFRTSIRSYLIDPEARGEIWRVGTQPHGQEFLLNLAQEIKSAQANDMLVGLRYQHYPQLSDHHPQMVQIILGLLGVEQIKLLLQAGPNIPAVPACAQGTQLDHFFSSIRNRPQTAPPADDVQFLLGWLMGQKISPAQQQEYGLTSREPLVSAVALPYLRVLFLMLREAKLCTKLLLMGDLVNPSRIAYDRFKNLHRLFNGDGLFILLGDPSID